MWLWISWRVEAGGLLSRQHKAWSSSLFLFQGTKTLQHGLIDYKDTKANCGHLKKFICKGTLRQVFICVRPRTPCSPPLTHCIRVYSLLTYSHREGGGKVGRVQPERRLEGQQFTKLGRKHQHDWLYLQSINLDKHLPQSPCTDHFLDDDILLWCLHS